MQQLAPSGAAKDRKQDSHGSHHHHHLHHAHQGNIDLEHRRLQQPPKRSSERASKSLKVGDLACDLSARGHLKTSPTILLPQGSKAAKSQRLTERSKDSRLRGSDLYVTRLRWKGKEKEKEKEATSDQSLHIDNVSAPLDEADDLNMNDGATHVTSALASSSTGSLHDELLCHSSRGTDRGVKRVQCSPKQQLATQSRPVSISFIIFS